MPDTDVTLESGFSVRHFVVSRAIPSTVYALRASGRRKHNTIKRRTVFEDSGMVPIQRWAFQRDVYERVKNDRHSSVQNSKYTGYTGPWANTP